MKGIYLQVITDNKSNIMSFETYQFGVHTYINLEI